VFIQHTIRKTVKAAGIGLHSGRDCSIALHPAPVDTGVVFRRNRIEVKAVFENVADTLFSTNLGFNGAKVRTVEHLLAAIYGIGINNIIVEVDGPELPIMDGSAGEFVGLLLKAGPVSQNKLQPYLKIRKPIVFGEGSAYIMALPADDYRISCRLNFNHPVIREEKLEFTFSRDAFIHELAGARTFGFLKDVDALQAQGLARGGSMDNAIVIGDDRVLNREGLRFKDEFVRHKMLDLIGDMSLFGLPIQGHIVANESGHRLHVAFLRHLAANSEPWEIVEAPLSESRNDMRLEEQMAV